MRYASFGSISSGTMREEDLLDTFASELEYHLERQPKSFARRSYRKLISEAHKELRRANVSEYAGETVNDLMDALSEFAPPYCYFGAHEGDGADYGFWVSDPRECGFDGLEVEDTGDVPRDYRGEVLHVNDHGNMTLYIANSRGLREVWACV